MENEFVIEPTQGGVLLSIRVIARAGNRPWTAFATAPCSFG